MAEYTAQGKGQLMDDSGWSEPIASPPSGGGDGWSVPAQRLRQRSPRGLPGTWQTGAWLLAAGAILALSMWLWFGDSLQTHVAGYLFAIAALTCVSLFRLKDSAAKASRNYESRTGQQFAATLIVVLCLGLIALHIWPLAQELARR